MGSIVSSLFPLVQLPLRNLLAFPASYFGPAMLMLHALTTPSIPPVNNKSSFPVIVNIDPACERIVLYEVMLDPLKSLVLQIFMRQSSDTETITGEFSKK